MSEISKRSTRKHLARRLIFIYLGIFLALILAWGIIIGWHASHLYSLARTLQAESTQINPETLLAVTTDAAGDISAIRQLLDPLVPVFNTFQGLPGIGPYFGQIEPVLIYADKLAEAGTELVLGLDPILNDSSPDQSSLSLPERITLALQSGQAHFIKAAQAIEAADQVRSRIKPELLPGSLRTQYRMLDDKFNLLQSGVQILQVAPQLLGTDGAQNYMILAQNRDELRATGGFISGIGLLTMDDGKIMHFGLGDSYQIDDFSKPYPKPPEPLKRFMLADYWVTRDANWSPDFPTSALQAQDLYTLSTGVQTQGVIAINQLVVKQLLEALGPVQVPGTQEPVTAENVEYFMRQAWAPSPDEGLSQEWWLHRKDFMQLLGSVILDRAMSTNNQELQLGLAKTIMKLLDQGQLLIYFNNPAAQSALETAGWDGGLHPGSSDYLYLVDSNVGFNKVDTIIHRSVSSRVDLSDLDHPVGELTLSYTHTGTGDIACKQEITYGNGTYLDMQRRCYLDYWRLYVPAGAGFISSNAQPVPAAELLNGMGWSGQVESFPGEAHSQVFAGLLMLPLAQTSRITISYTLPPGIIREVGAHLYEYSLSIQVQPGLDGLPFHLVITLPENSTPQDLDEGWQSLDAHSLIWNGTLNQPTVLRLLFQTGLGQ